MESKKYVNDVNGELPNASSTYAKKCLTSNPFSKYIAKPLKNKGGWIDTKKRGKDDDQIDVDKERATVARQTYREKQKELRNQYSQRQKDFKKQIYKKRKEEVKAKKKKKRNYESSEDESNIDSIDDFIVGDDEEEESASDVGEENDETILIDSVDKPQTKKLRTKQFLSLKSLDKGQDNLKDDIPKLQAKKSYFDGGSRSKSNKKRCAKLFEAPNKTASTLESSSTLKKPLRRIQKSVINDTGKDILSSSSFDGEYDFEPYKRKSINSKAKQCNTRATPKENDSIRDDTDDSYVEVTRQKKKKGKKYRHRRIDSNDESDLEMNEAIALSEALARSQSDFEHKTSKDNDAGFYGKEDEEMFYVDDNSDESVNDIADVEDDYIDPTSKDEKEAQEVLNAANQLSVQIFEALKSWSCAFDAKDGAMKKGVNGEPQNIPKGLIVDGALCLGSLKREHVKSSKSDKTPSLSEDDSAASVQTEKGHTEQVDNAKIRNNSSIVSWISVEKMKELCPDISLKDYQLIGVNWMALLHQLKFKLKNSSQAEDSDCEKNTGDGESLEQDSGERNVNGILADEMGLGKTVQTIAFLAWLKNHESASEQVDDLRNHNTVIEMNSNSINEINISDDGSASEGDKSSDDEELSIIEERETFRKHDINDPKKYHAVPHLIIVPPSVLSNWHNEFKKVCPSLNVVKYHGTTSERDKMKTYLRKVLFPIRKKGHGFVRKSSLSKNVDVVLTSFSYFSSEKNDDLSFLRKFRWNYMVVDEGHSLKNPKSLRYKNMDSFTTRHRLLLTGTPVQNSPQELLSLLCFLMPLFSKKTSSMFDNVDGNDGGARMLEFFVRIRSSGNKKNHIKSLTEEEQYEKLKQLFAPFVLRRLKVDVLGQMVPPKTRTVERVPFDNKSKEIYDGVLSLHIKSKKEKKNISLAQKKNVFVELRKAANHSLMLRKRYLDNQSISHLSKHLWEYGYFGRHQSCTLKLVQDALKEFSDFDIHSAALTLIEEHESRATELTRYILPEEELFTSPKFLRLKTLLPQLIRNGHRILIFSQWTRILDLLECLMNFLDLRFFRLDGQTNVSTRQEMIDEFNNDTSIPIFLLSTRAGGMGINLTSADVCILHDLDANPFNDLQAEDRCHRIGQKKPVKIIKLVTENTVDAAIYELQERKAKMNDAIFGGKSSNRGKEEAKEMIEIMDNAVTKYEKSLLS